MTIPTIEYRGYELRAYSQQVFPLHRDPYAKGAKQFSSVVRIDTVPTEDLHARRYSTVFSAASPARASDAIDLAMQYGKDVIRYSRGRNKGERPAR
jgi:hypothetical protein